MWYIQNNVNLKAGFRSLDMLQVIAGISTEEIYIIDIETGMLNEKTC